MFGHASQPQSKEEAENKKHIKQKPGLNTVSAADGSIIRFIMHCIQSWIKTLIIRHKDYLKQLCHQNK